MGDKASDMERQRDEAAALLRELIWAVRRAHPDTQSMLADRGDALLRRMESETWERGSEE